MQQQLNFLVSGLQIRLGHFKVLPYHQVQKNELLHLHFNIDGTLLGSSLLQDQGPVFNI